MKTSDRFAVAALGERAERRRRLREAAAVVERREAVALAEEALAAMDRRIPPGADYARDTGIVGCPVMDEADEFAWLLGPVPLLDE